MNGFEPLRRRVVDYTAAGQWQKVYDGPIEECEEYRLAAENAKLRELMRDIWNQARLLDTNAHIDGLRLTEQAREEYMSRMKELGVEV